MSVPWRYYPACGTCGAGPAKPCPGRFGARTAPHTGRRRQKTDQTPPPPPRLMCAEWHPHYRPGFIPCSRKPHQDDGHVHASRDLGVIHWRTAQP